MLNQLIESKNHRQENARRSGFLLSTLGILLAVLVSGWTYSLFAKNLGLGAGDFEMSNLIAPVAAAEEPPPAPKPDIKPEKAQNSPPDKTILKEFYDDMASTKLPPKDTRGEREVINARRIDLNTAERGSVNQIAGNSSGRTTSDTPGCGLCASERDNEASRDDEIAPEIKPKQPKPEQPAAPKAPNRPVSIGVVNGKAINLVKPPYPAAAKAVRAEGAVNVQVVIDEQGNVISATAVSGHPLLRAAAATAARQSKFTPTLLSKQPVKVTGVIIYNFMQ